MAIEVTFHCDTKVAKNIKVINSFDRNPIYDKNAQPKLPTEVKSIGTNNSGIAFIDISYEVSNEYSPTKTDQVPPYRLKVVDGDDVNIPK
jgi:hypothetical protein